VVVVVVVVEGEVVEEVGEVALPLEQVRLLRKLRLELERHHKELLEEVEHLRKLHLELERHRMEHLLGEVELLRKLHLGQVVEVGEVPLVGELLAFRELEGDREQYYQVFWHRPLVVEAVVEEVVEEVVALVLL
jgi:hypothetical protein